MQQIISDAGEELLEDIAEGESQMDSGKGIPHDKAREIVLNKIPK